MNAEEKEDLRHACLSVLACRHPAALPVRAIRRKAADEVDFKIEDDDVAAACQFLVALTPPLARVAPDPLGSTQYFVATPEGVLVIERGFK